MQCLGIDVGTDSVRLCVSGTEGQSPSFYESQLPRTSSGRHHTMSVSSLWDSIMSMFARHDTIYRALRRLFDSQRVKGLGESGHSKTKDCKEVVEGRDAHGPRFGVCVGATCSMVVMERVVEEGQYFFRALEPGHEIIVWMDVRAQQEAEIATRLLPDWALRQIGGRVTPEMGIAKLLWVDRYYKASQKNVCVFELYDWVSYMFLAGGYQDGRVRCLAQDEPMFGPGQSAMDGSLKGWSADILESLSISTKVVATPNSADPALAFPEVGTPLGTVGDFIVGHGCIDCYAPWAGLAASKEGAGNGARRLEPALAETRLLLVAGTSTCGIVSSQHAAPMEGFWGPFGQLSSQPVCTFGQPATGQLFQELIQEFRGLVPANEDAFSFMEHHAQRLEAERNAPLTVLARHYLYYGDKHGNRSPYGSFHMGEVYADGVNAASNDTFRVSLRERSVEALVLRYYLTLEFLLFQTAQLCLRLAATCGPIATVHLEGSQAQNHRFVGLLKCFVFPQSRLFIRKDATSKFSGCRGVAASLARKLIPSGGMWGDWCEVKDPGMDGAGTLQDVLVAKHEAFLQLAEWQAAFRRKMDSLSLAKHADRK